MRRETFFLLCASFGNAAALPPAPTATNVHGQGVTYSGLYQNEIEGFLGIRYAHDTGGENRFKPPIAYTPGANSSIDATNAGPSCPQGKSHGIFTVWDNYDYITEISEDCLALNVWRPNGTKAGDALPVLVYIHGGSFRSGSKDGNFSQPGGMQLQAIDNGHPIMNVELNYRLGPFGFAQTDALLKEGATNAGIRDQRLALEWVRDNIAAFGGDPEKVTIHGQSSGGTAVGFQIMAYGGSRPSPFQQAICESQCLDLAITGNVTRHSMARTWAKTSCANLTFDSAANVECLRNISMKELLSGELAINGAGPASNSGDNWLPVVDGDIVPAAPSTLIAERKFYNVSTIIGWCDNDAVVFTPYDIATPHQTEHWVRKYLPGFTDSHIQELLALYPSSDFAPSHLPNGTIELYPEFFRTARIYRDLVFTCQPIHIGHALAAAGNPVYFYDQNQTMLGPALHQEGAYGFGVVHTSELVYVFGNLTKMDQPDTGVPYHPSASDFRLRTQESRSWSSFTALGRPSLEGHDTLTGWEQATFDDENYGTYVIGGAYSGYAGTGSSSSSSAREVMAKEELTKRCGFINSPEIIKEMLY